MTDKIQPAMFRWVEVDVQTPAGELHRLFVMVPHTRFAPLCERQFEAGEDYALTTFERPSTRSQGHFFAVVRAVWDNMPESLAKRFPSSEHLRKWALVEVGHATEAVYVLDSEKDAGIFAKAMRKADHYAVIMLSGNVVKVFTAKSMKPSLFHNKAEYQELKDRVFVELTKLTGNTLRELEHEGAQQSAPAGGPAMIEHHRSQE